jgi:hypothetical protein
VSIISYDRELQQGAIPEAALFVPEYTQVCRIILSFLLMVFFGFQLNSRTGEQNLQKFVKINI